MSDFISIGQALEQFIRKSRMASGLRALQVTEVWEKLMGKTIAKYTDRIEIVNGTLFISTGVGPLRQELMYQRDQILQRVNEELGEAVVREVVIR